MSTINDKINKYKAFWDRSAGSPLTGYSIGSYFISKRFHAVEGLLAEKGRIEPERINVEDFREDYLRIYAQWERENSEVLFTGAPFPGLPWMEAILGCDIYSTECSFVAHSPCDDIDRIHIEKVINKAWFDKYIEFTLMLKELGMDKFPVGQPIMRGPTDIAGTLLGQDKLIFHFYDHPEKVAKMLNDWADIFLYVIKEQKKCIDRFAGGYAMGFYDLWCPGDCIWYQDDLNALLSPGIYHDFVYDIHKKICQSYEYTMIHLHPASFYIVDDLLGIDELKAVQVNKDIGGPSVEEMLPILKKVQKKKNLVLWGDFDDQELDYLRNNMDPGGLYIIVFKEHA